MSNRLAGEKSPYLLQHAENPVDWYPWGEEAFRKARSEDKPIFLSIGYSTCHWCHVMEHESFEDNEVASLLNDRFVSIKVDREERPDIDQVYMTVCQATTGSGGWPLSVFIGPGGEPFFAGTYFPKRGRLGMPGFMEIAGRIADLWRDGRPQLSRISEEITKAIQPKPLQGEQRVLGREALERAYRQLGRSFDPVWGGFGSAPKFPTPHNLSFLMRWHRREPQSNALEMVEKTLSAMRAGGIFDQIGFGFHRYSVDEKWLVPHFEKMLYDQALLALAYTDAFLITGNPDYSRVVNEIFEYVIREMRSPEGGFYCAEDADSEGKEGVFYTWNPEQVSKIIGKDAGEVFCRVYGISPQGNFEEGMSIAHLPRSIGDVSRELGMGIQELNALIEDSRKRLFSEREKRVHPHKDDKILVSWNGLMIAALARGAQALGDASYASIAREAADFILRTMKSGAGRLHRRYRQGEVANPGYADDYAFLIWGLLELYETVFKVKYLGEAVRLQEQMSELFGDSSEGGFFFTGRDSEEMLVAEKVIYDGAMPSSNSVAALNLLRLGRMTGNPGFEEQADLLMKSFSGQVSQLPPAYTHYMQALDFVHGPAREIVIAGDCSSSLTREMIRKVHRLYLPHRVLLVKEKGPAGKELAGIAPYTEGLALGEDGPVAYLCENFSCRSPLTDASELETFLKE
ncbi:MAG: thioredoxin domain-containing protein [Syntrophobacteraceae bacterium]